MTEPVVGYIVQKRYKSDEDSFSSFYEDAEDALNDVGSDDFEEVHIYRAVRREEVTITKTTSFRIREVKTSE